MSLGNHSFISKIFLTLTVSLVSLSAYAVTVKDWEYKQSMTWRGLVKSGISVDYAEAQVDDDKISIIYDKEKNRWYFQFTYIDTRILTGKQPEFFIRTNKDLGSGRYSSDYVIKNKADVFYNTPGKPQLIIMQISTKDIAAIKAGFELGVGYYTSNKVTWAEGKAPVELGSYKSYLFPGKGSVQAIEKIEIRNKLPVIRAQSRKELDEHFEKIKQIDQNRKLLEWYQGDWAEVTANGQPIGRSCQTTSEIVDINELPDLMQRGRFLGKWHKGALAISGRNSSDHLYISSAYSNKYRDPSDKFNLVHKGSETRKIPLFIEQGKDYMRLRLGSEIPGIKYKRIIDFHNGLLKLVAYDTGGKEAKIRYFKRCSE